MTKVLDRKIVRRIAGVVPAQMFACGLAWLAADVIGLGYIRGAIFLASLVTILLLNVIFYNKVTKIAGAVLAAAGVVVVLYFGFTGRLAEPLAALVGELAELFGRGIGDEELKLLVGRMLGVVAGVAAFCTAGGLRGGVVMAICSLAAFCAAWYSGERGIFGCMALCASATAAVSAAGFARRRAGDIEKAMESEQEEDDGGRDRQVERRRRRSKRGGDVGDGGEVVAERKRLSRKAARRAQASAVDGGGEDDASGARRRGGRRRGDAAPDARRRGRDAAAGDVRRRGGRRRELSGAAAASVGTPSGVALFAIPVVLLIAVICTLFRPEAFARSLRVRAVEGALDDAIDSIAQNIDGFTRRTTVFSLNAVGYGPAADLGGPVDLLEDTMLVVRANRVGYLNYLRGSVRSSYDGNGWREGELGGSYRFASRLWDEQREDAFDLLRGGMAEANAYFSTAYKRVGYSVQHYSHYTSMFTLDRPEAAESNLYTPYFNLQGELFPKGSMESGSAYSVSGYAFQSMTKAVARSLANLVERYAPDEEYVRSEFEEKMYADYLPDGEVEITVAEDERMITPSVEGALAQGVYYDERFGWIQTPRAYLASSPYVLGAYVLPDSEAMLADAKDWNYFRAVDYYLFYGYTAEDMALIAENEQKIAEQQVWLNEHRAEQYHELLMDDFKEGLEWPEAQPMWLTEAQLAVYGLDGEAMDSLRLDSRRDEQIRGLSREMFFVATRSEERYSIAFESVEALPVEEPEEGVFYYPMDEGIDLLVPNGAKESGVRMEVDVIQEPVEGTGYYTANWVDESVAEGFVRCAQENGFARLEFAEKATYYPEISGEYAKTVALGYLTTLDDDDEVNKFEMLLEVAKAIDASSRYTLDPTPVPDGVDFVDWFISTNEGYCTYYASAMVIMARELGVPARYAEGYVLGDAEGFTTAGTIEYELTGYDAHAWAEVWFDGVGWVVLDPLGLDLLDSDLPDEDLPDVEVEMPVPSLEPTVEPTVEPVGEDEPEGDGGLPGWAVALIAVGGVLFAAVFAFAMVRVLVVRTRSLERLRRKHGDKAAAKLLWSEILRALEMLEPLCVRGDGETASEFAERVKGLVFVEGAPFVEVARAAEVAWYAAREISESELALLDRCAKEMRRLMFRRAPLKVFWMMK